MKRVTLSQPLIHEDLKAHWKFDEGQGINVEDSTGNYAAGIIHGGYSGSLLILRISAP